MDQIVKLVTEKTGISETQAKMAVETVTNFLKDKLPGGLGSQVESFINGGASGSIGNIAEELKDKLGGIFEK